MALLAPRDDLAQLEVGSTQSERHSNQNTSSAVMAQRIEPADSADLFPTPPWATRALVEWISSQDMRVWEQSVWEQSVWEPAAGLERPEDYRGAIWRPRKINPQTNQSEIDRTRVNVVRSDVDEEEEARALGVSVNAIDHPAWVASIIDAMGFALIGCRFGTTLADKVPDEHWDFLSDAVARREAVQW